MAQVVLALGSNLNNPHQQLQQALKFLSSISETEVKCSPIYISEPVGPADHDFLNAVVIIETGDAPNELLEMLKEQEQKQGRPSRYPKWTARTIDLDIIGYDDLVIETDSLIIPHREYTERLFVLLPLRDVLPQWTDPATAQDIDTLIKQAPEIKISQTTLEW
ncbi:MAG: 2-amino-4-hydroxy-6-hydroxymethyldihydropteridine diphosphokinase [Balneolaceae bacterium]|nr:2-amino-4-hydroxy-6-hydroxymethyldihydropteridine diphosphokinase [Balneolaceae bacterium]